MRAVAIGFPKSGTSTLQRALTHAGLRCFHQFYRNKPVGKLVYDGLRANGDPFTLMPGADVLTQMDICRPNLGLNFWPNLDLAVLVAIRARHPDCLLILNRRDPAATAASMARWDDLQARITLSDIPGLPQGHGGETRDLEGWIVRHHAAVEAMFGGRPGFLDLDITAPDARDRLGAALGIAVTWWGRANRNRATEATAPAPAPEA